LLKHALHEFALFVEERQACRHVARALHTPPSRTSMSRASLRSVSVGAGA
jgi:hypothetical protein